MSENIKHIIALVFILVLAGAFYYFSQSDTIFRNHQKRSAEIASETARLKREVIAPLERLDTVEINIDLFTGVEYKALKDISVTLKDPDLQRNNPFAPVEAR